MVEPSVIIWTAIGIVIGALPSVILAVWREVRERRIQRDELEAQRRRYGREMVLKGMDRGYEMLLDDDSESYRPPDRR